MGGFLNSLQAEHNISLLFHPFGNPFRHPFGMMIDGIIGHQNSGLSPGPVDQEQKPKENGAYRHEDSAPNSTGTGRSLSAFTMQRKPNGSSLPLLN